MQTASLTILTLIVKIDFDKIYNLGQSFEFF
jgi:hypothetical protein